MGVNEVTLKLSGPVNLELSCPERSKTLDCLTKMLSSEFLLPQGVWDVMRVLVYFSLEACVHFLNVKVFTN